MGTRYFIWSLGLLFLLSCSSGGDESVPEKPGPTNSDDKREDNSDKEPTFVSHITPIEKLNQSEGSINSHADVYSRSSLKMNYRMFLTTSFQETGYPRYPRIKKMKNGKYILFYHNGSSSNNIGRRCFYALSDDMKTWSYKAEIFNSYNITDSNGNKNIHCYANCDGTVLSNGDILAVVSYRADTGYRQLSADAGIEIRRSKDNGVTWSDPIKIYQGVNWEPFILELPSGELQCYFTDASRTGLEGHGTDTGTAMVSSKDGGVTWTPGFASLPYYVFRMRWEKDGIVGYNHQMPTVVKLNEDKGLAAAVETNYLGSYSVSLCYSDKMWWNYLNAGQEGPSDSNNRAYSGSGPYIGQFPSGETVLSYESSSKYTLRIGDSMGRNFGNTYQPFSGGYWASLNVATPHILLGTNVKEKTGPIQVAQFVLNHKINAVRRSVNVDGSNAEWVNTDHALFVGDKSQAQGTIRCSFDDTNIYFLVEVLDRTPSQLDYSTIYISQSDKSQLTSGDVMLQVNSAGMKSCKVYGTQWDEKDISAKVKSFLCNSNTESDYDKYGYVSEISIPRSKLKIVNGEILVNFSVFDKTSNVEDAIYETNSYSTRYWIPVSDIK